MLIFSIFANMYLFMQLLLFCVTANAAPINENRENEINNSTLKNDVEGQSKAGIIDTLNPFNKNEPPATSNKNEANEQNNNPLAPIQNLFNNIPQANFLNLTSNPFGQLFSTGQGGNFLNDVKVFLVGTQGMVFPASAILGGFQNFMQNIGNVASLLQAPPNLLPSLPTGK